MSLFKRLRHFDWWILASSLGLVALGLTVIGTTGTHTHSDALQQGLYVVIGLIVFMLTARFDYRLIKRYTPALYLIMIVLLILVHLVGSEILGARRWIDVGFFQLQPSEIAKVIFLIILAKYFSSRPSDRLTIREIGRSAIYLALPLGLVITQPDLGTALVFLAIWIVFILSAGIRPWQFVGLSATAALAVPVGWRLLKPYQQERLLTFLDPGRDPLGTGYNVTQARIAVGSGELWGRGLGHGTQSNLSFLPVQHTDFIFAALAEELGFAGSVALLGLYLILLVRSIHVVRIARDRFGMFLALGVTTMLLFHILVNVGMNMGIMPVTGIPLPLVSYGGTSVIMTFFALGLLESIALRHRGLNL